MELPFNWRERLEQLRREQNPDRYREDRPALRLPLHPPPPPKVDEPEPEAPRVIIIDI